MYRQNDVIAFKYWQPLTGEENRYGKIVRWRKLTKQHIARLNRTSSYRWSELGSEFERIGLPGVLLTVENVDGSFQNYYTKKIPLPQKKSKIVFKVCQHWHKLHKVLFN